MGNKSHFPVHICADLISLRWNIFQLVVMNGSLICPPLLSSFPVRLFVNKMYFAVVAILWFKWHSTWRWNDFLTEWSTYSICYRGDNLHGEVFCTRASIYRTTYTFRQLPMRRNAILLWVLKSCQWLIFFSTEGWKRLSLCKTACLNMKIFFVLEKLAFFFHANYEMMTS